MPWTIQCPNHPRTYHGNQCQHFCSLQLYNHLESQGFSEGLQLWLGSSLISSQDGGYEWTFNIEGAAEMYEDYQEQELWDVVALPPDVTTLHLVRAANSDRSNPCHQGLIRSEQHPFDCHCMSCNEAA